MFMMLSRMLLLIMFLCYSILVQIPDTSPDPDGAPLENSLLLWMNLVMFLDWCS
jgi:hypothetical protein